MPDATAFNYQDEIITNVTQDFSIIDRLKILLNGRACVRVSVHTANVVGYCQSSSESWTPPLFPKKDGGGYEIQSEPEQL